MYKHERSTKFEEAANSRAVIDSFAEPGYGSAGAALKTCSDGNASTVVASGLGAGIQNLTRTRSGYHSD